MPVSRHEELSDAESGRPLAKQRDRLAFAVLWNRHLGKSLLFAQRIVRSDADAQRWIYVPPDILVEMQRRDAIIPSYRFRRSGAGGLIEVINEGSYVMAEYSERTGAMKWQRVVLASQRQQIEEWLAVHYPIQSKA